MTDISRRSGASRVGSPLAHRGADVVLVTVRELRLLLGLLLILFVTSETWRWIGRLTVPRLVLFVLATVAVALLVVVLGLARTVQRRVIRRATLRVAAEVIAFGTFLFVTFALIGLVSVGAGLVADWSGGDAGILVSLAIGDPPMVVTRPLLQVAAFLGAFGALAFAVEVIADPGTRHSLLRDLDDPAERT